MRHFSARGYLGKAMFVAIDKATAVRMYDKVRRQWAAMLVAERKRLAKARREARASTRGTARLDARAPTWRWSSARARTKSPT